MTDVSVACAGDTLVLCFGWTLDDEPAPKYVLPMTTMRADATLAADALITRLDLFLDTDTWKRHAHDIGHDTRVVVMPPLHGGR
ncbi:hypothetical protein DFR70_101401 [Nocardia tenerifensis]|uniref:Uncharacterized protein n=1 Tax=Nocardia tenerifensis TaxID=228006 RepID=A0A318KMQ9_9NOCA|nr:hypothetical protein [Nocardia tenerifensis]PXX70980.1 hypothetical protein DFR70_101401 [Nocardia tenerifensis]